jgi:hypothetical protein
MANAFTLATVTHHRDEVYEALYLNGRLIKFSEDGAFTASEVLEAVAMHDIGVLANYVDVDIAFDEEVIAMSGWPEKIEDVKHSAGASPSSHVPKETT